MAVPSPALIQALRTAAQSLADGQAYQWGHMGSCNCGHLAQAITHRSKAEIHARALRTRSGDWTEQLYDYCPTSGLPLDEVIDEMLAAGLYRTDLEHLEKLSDPRILRQLNPAQLPLARNRRADAVLYLSSWATMLELEWLEQQAVSEPRWTPPQSISEKSLARLEIT